MQIVRDLAGYSMGRSDLVRRAMSKKKADVMATERHNFIFGIEADGVDGCIKRGVSEEVANSIYDDMVDFAKYAFNKSHAAAYAVVAYQTGWLRCHYPVEFMASMMNTYPGKVTEYIQILRSEKVELLPPDINESYTGFSVVAVKEADGRVTKKIRYGMASIKNVGSSFIDRLVEERRIRGPFASMTDFCRRMQDLDLNKRSMENMIKAGAFDTLGGCRSQYLQSYPMIMNGAASWKKSMMSGQMDLFDMAMDDPEGQMGSEDQGQDPLPDIEEFPEALKLAYEKEVLGLYLTGHPLLADEKLWRKTITNPASDFKYVSPEDEGGMNVEDDLQSGASRLTDGQEVIVGGMITGKTVKSTKTNKLMAFITVEDLVGTVEILVFPNRYDDYKALLEEDRKVFVKGRVSVDEEADSKIICDTIAPFEDVSGLYRRRLFRQEQNREQNLDEKGAADPAGAAEKVQAAENAAKPAKPLWLRLPDMTAWKEKQILICSILETDPGTIPVRIYLEKERQRLAAPEKYCTAFSDITAEKLKELLGPGNVV